ncbi:peptidoglycan-recognition protein LC-like [Arctopsyche grandis]|uniref:peptidoglycan-recognition protein LC-like n=1 Tax=Arctopsyche grandis TaxID=121162 RepID=UPI00406D9B88
MVTRDVYALAPARWDVQHPEDPNQEEALPPDEALTHIIESTNTAHNFGQISVAESNEIHFGNKTFIHGPVTIKQFISTVNNASEMAQDNPTFLPDSKKVIEDKEVVPVTPKEDPPHFNYPYGDILRRQFSLKKKLLFAFGIIFSILFIVGLIYLIKSLHIGSTSKLTDSKHNDEDLVKNIPIETDIDKVLILSKNLRTISRSEWLAQPPSGELDVMTTPVPYVIITHTATEGCKDQAQCTFRVRFIQTFHIESRSWFDIGYNFAIGGDGSAYEGRGWDKAGAHTKGYNAKSIGIGLIGTFTRELPPQRQLLATKQLIELGVSLGKISKDYKLFGHRQLIPTVSPGDALFKEIQTWPHFSNNITLSTRK